MTHEEMSEVSEKQYRKLAPKIFAETMVNGHMVVNWAYVDDLAYIKAVKETPKGEQVRFLSPLSKTEYLSVRAWRAGGSKWIDGKLGSTFKRNIEHMSANWEELLAQAAKTAANAPAAAAASTVSPARHEAMAKARASRVSRKRASVRVLITPPPAPKAEAKPASPPEPVVSIAPAVKKARAAVVPVEAVVALLETNFGKLINDLKEMIANGELEGAA